MNMGLCELYQNMKYESGISDFQYLIAEFRFVIKFVIIPQTLIE